MHGDRGGREEMKNPSACCVHPVPLMVQYAHAARVAGSAPLTFSPTVLADLHHFGP